MSSGSGSNKTIGAIAMGTRRSGRTLTLRLRGQELDELVNPTLPREWKSSLKESFKDPEAFRILIEDIRRLDTELTNAIKEDPVAFTPSSSSLQANIIKYQEYIDVFVAIFAQFTCKDIDGDLILDALKSQRCPEVDMFRRLVVNPNFIAREDVGVADGGEGTEMVDSDNRKVPLCQLARICDVSILRFLGNVTEKTPPIAIHWALDYISCMTKRIGDSLKDHSETGWYGLSFRKRKSTIRNSTTEVPVLALDGQPLVIGFGPLEPVVTPETGQTGRFNPVPSINVSDHMGGRVDSLSSGRNLSGSSLRSDSSDTSLSIELSPGRSSPSPTLPELRSFGSTSPVISSNPSKQRRHSVTTKPLELQQIEVEIMDTPTRRSSTGTRDHAPLTTPMYHHHHHKQRKTSIVDPVKAVIESIDEGDEQGNAPRPGVRVGLAPPINHTHASSLDRVTRSSSPLLMSLSPPTPVSPPKKQQVSSDSDQSDDESDTTTDGPSSYKYKPRNLSYAGPPPLTTYTLETMQNELHTLITHNGRISLLSILITISKLPSNPELWTEENWDACKVCISLIQFCVDFGLDTQKKDAENVKSIPFHRQRAIRTDPRVLEKPSVVYSRLILKHSLKALIHCAVSTYTGCLIDTCRVNTYYSKNASQNLNKMMHQLERLYSNSPLLFRESMIEFGNTAPLKRVFHFLHVILQYCPRGNGRDPLDPSSSRRDPLIVLSATVLRIIVDRMVLLNMSEPLLEHSIVKEAMAFVRFTYTLFNQDFLRTKGFTHFQGYVNRVALSILLPLRPPTLNHSSFSSTHLLQDMSGSDTFPRQSKKKKGGAGEGGAEPQSRKRGHTVNYGSGDVSAGQSPLLSHKSPSASRKPKLTKQTSIHSDSELPTNDNNDNILQELQKEWRGMHIGVLHQRIRRLSVMMELTEPGLIPDASLLASLISVGPPGSVIPRALVLLECSLFVSKLNNEELTAWMKNQPGKYAANWELFRAFKSWGEAIGEALSACEITEKELLAKDSNDIAEEPIFMDEERDPDKRYIVNHSLKMVACSLLIEITKFCREPPPRFLPTALPHPSSIRRSNSSQSQERKASNISVLSSDSDTNPSPTPSYVHARNQQGSLDYYRKGSSPLLDDVPRFLSTDHPPSSPNTSSHVSMYLRVNSRHGKKHPRTQSHSTQGAARGKSHQTPAVEIPGDTYRIVSSGSPVKSARRMSVSAAAFLNQPQIGTESHGHNSSIRHRGRPSVSVNAQAVRRKSFSSSAIRPRRETSPVLSHAETTSRGVQAAVTPPTSARLNSPQGIKRRPSVLGRVFQRGRQIAHRGRRPNQQGETGARGRVSTTTTTSSAASSPSLARQKSVPINRTDTWYDNKLMDVKSHFPWLDVVEHMIVSFYSTSSELQDKRKQSCCELMMALRYIFSLKFEKDKSPAHGNTPSSPAADRSRPRSNVEASLATAFTDRTLLSDTEPPTNMTGKTPSRTMGSIIRQNPPPAAKDVSFKDMPRALGKLDFSGVRLRRFLESGMSWGCELGDNVTLQSIFGEDQDLLHTSIDYMLETDSAISVGGLLESYNSTRLQYISTLLAGLLHTPFSLLTYAAPVLPPSTFRDLQESSWIALCDSDYEYADAAASFFLLCCVKEKESMYTFLKSKARTNHPIAVKDAVTRFEILWRCRDGVWARMEQSAPKLFKLDEETADTIGYSLPSQLLGIPGESLPHAPWKPLSICTHDHLKENVQCYQGTKHAPLEHLSNVVNTTRFFPVSGFSVVQMEVDTAPAVVNSNALLELDREEFEQGRIKVKDIHKLSTLFPTDLLPLITMVIKALEPPHNYTEVLLKADSDTNIPSITQISSMAERLLWHCMLDNSYYLFYPLLNQFNVLYKVIKDNKRKPKSTVEEYAEEILEDILRPFHTLLSHFPHLPPKASHMLFNNFVGIIMRHTEQPVVMSDVIIHSVLNLLRMIVPSMKGLTLKELKNQLKKESCYTAILTTARIRGVEKIKLVYENQSDETKDVKVLENMKFLDVIHREHVNTNGGQEDDPFNAFYSYYLTEEKKSNRTVLSSLVIQDHYPATADFSVPTFTIHKSASTKQAMKEQEELLHIHKMTELARIMFTIEMMKIDTSSIGLQQEFAQPNPTFVLAELQGLNSFPRKTLTSLLDEVGLSGELHLRMVDTMLRGVWSKFILNLFIRVKDYQPSDNVVLFLTVINGSLLLQAEDSSTLRYSLASLLIAAKKFESVFRLSAYQMVVPMLLRVYSLHSRNKMVKDAIKYLWTCFYSLGKNTFLLQAIVSIANLFSPDVAGIASKMKVNYCPLRLDWQAEEQTTIVRSVMELFLTLDCPHNKLPQDKLDIQGMCPKEMDLSNLLSQQSWSGCALEQVIPFCVTVASFNPEVLRGMQVLVFVDNIIVQLIKEYVKKGSFNQIAMSIRSLIKGCESLKRSIKSNLPSSKGVNQPSSILDDHIEGGGSARKSKVYIRKLFSKKRSETSQSLHSTKDRSVSELNTEEQWVKYFDEFRNRSLQNITQQIVTLSRDSLLSIAAQLVCHTPSDEIRTPFDSSSLMNICSITEKVLRLASKGNQDCFLHSKGVSAVFNDLLPKVIWDAENISSLLLLLERMYKIFRKLQSDYSLTSSIPWNDLTNFIKSIHQCVSNYPLIVTDNDQILFRIKAILEVCLTTKTVPSANNKKRSSHYFIQDAPMKFIIPFVDLCTEMIVRTQGQSTKHRVVLSGLFESALDFKRSESNSVWEKMFLPLSLKLGLRGSSCISCTDTGFIMENIKKMADHIQVVIERVKDSSQKEQIKRYFTSMKVLLSAYSFSQEQWIAIGYHFLASTSKFDQNAINELYFEFCLEFLHFWESFLLLSRLPIFSISWHVITVIENQLSVAKRNGCQSSVLDAYLSKCREILSDRSLLPVYASKRELLLYLEEELLSGTQTSERRLKTRKQFTTDETVTRYDMPLEEPVRHHTWSQPPLKRRNSKAPGFPAIEEGEVETNLNSPDSLLLGKNAEQHVTPVLPSPSRPTSLAFKPSFDKTQKQDIKSGGASTKLFKSSKQSVSFVEGASNKSPSSRRIFKQLKSSSPVIEKQKKTYKSSSRRIPHAERFGGKDKGESGFEADEEDASFETPRSSLAHSSFSISQIVQEHGQTLETPNKTNTLTISAEVHEQELSLTESEEESTLSISSDDDEPGPATKATRPPTQNSPDPILKQDTATSYDSPSSKKRQIFKLTHSRNVHIDEPDEQTGQIKREYFETRPANNQSPPLPPVNRESKTFQHQKLFDNSLKQVDGFLPQHHLEEWPPDDDDCSV